jgi:hypothetical protein
MRDYQLNTIAPDYSTNSGAGLDPSNPWNSLLSSGTGIYTGIAGAQANQQAASQMTTGYQNAIGTQQQYLGQAVAPWQAQYQTGVGANANLASVLGLNGAAPNYSLFNNSPGYQFSLNQADQALNRQAAANGNLYSTTTLANLGQLNAGYASQNYNNYVQQLLQSAQLGGQANTALTQANLQTGSNISQAQANIGRAQAAGTLGAASANASAVGAGANALGQFLNGLFPGAGGGNVLGAAGGFVRGLFGGSGGSSSGGGGGYANGPVDAYGNSPTDPNYLTVPGASEGGNAGYIGPDSTGDGMYYLPNDPNAGDGMYYTGGGDSSGF